MLTFDPDTHIYKMDYRVVPSVTQIIGEWIEAPYYYINTFTGAVVKKEVFEGGGDHGIAVHKGCWLILKHGHDGLDWELLDPSLIHQLQQFEGWMEDFFPEIVFTEEAMYSEKFGYAGTPDIIAEMRAKRVVSAKRIPAVIDIKTGAFDMAGPQIAGYEQLYKETFKYRGTVLRYVLHLPKTGPYKFIPLTDKRDWDFFRSRLFQYNYLNS